MKISQLKSNIQDIITSLTKLEKLRDTLVQNPNNLSCVTTKISKLKIQIDLAFAKLESEPLNKCVAEISKRKSKRRTKRLRAKSNKQSNKCRSLHDSSSSVKTSEPSDFNDLKKSKLRCSKKYLAFIDSLETLHRLKGGNDLCKLKESLASIKSIWLSTKNQINEETKSNLIRQSWDKVLFGGKSEIEFTPQLYEFAERRSIWDTYLDSSHGSHIPVGWVYPKENTQSEWKQFLQLTQI